MLKVYRVVFILSLFFFFPALAKAASLSIVPASGSYTVGAEITAEIKIDTAASSTDGIDIHYLRFDASKLSVVDADVNTAGVQITPGVLFANTTVNAADNTSGTIDFSQAAAGGTNFSGTGTVATIKFSTLAAGSVSLNFDFISGRTSDTNIASAGNDILSVVSGAVFSVAVAGNQSQPSSGGGGGSSSASAPQPEIKQEQTPTSTNKHVLEINKNLTATTTITIATTSAPSAVNPIQETKKEIISAEAVLVFSNDKFVPLNKNTLLLYQKTIGVTSGLSDKEKRSVAYFIHYGTPMTEKLGAGERAGTLASYHAAFGRYPKTEEQWQDAVKIANGRWTKEKSAKAENEAKKIFKVVYKREARSDIESQGGTINEISADQNALKIIAYGLRPAKRNANSEKAAINSFKTVYKKNPVSANDWNLVRAIAYSGARK